MNFLHLSAADHGGAGIAARRLHDGVRTHGHQSRMLVLDKRTQDADVFVLPGPRQLFLARRFASKASLKFLADDDYYFQDQSLSPVISPARVLDQIGLKPDVIVVNFISHFLSFLDVLALHQATGAPVVWHLLDMSAMTGGCHYAWACEGYQRHCGRCPALRFSHKNDRSASIFKDKAAALSNMRSIVVAGSSMLHRQAAGSSLFSKLQITTLLLGVSPDAFSPCDQMAQRRVFGLQGEGPVIFFGAQRFGQRRKGMRLLLAALQKLAADWPAGKARPMLLLAGDATDFPDLTPLGLECQRLGFIDTATLARAYAAADVFACPSIEDSGPMMINESMMCGTPVVAFRMGVAEDLIDTDVTGMIVPLGKVPEFSAALAQVLRWDEQQRSRARSNCRRVALQRCSVGHQVGRFVEISQALVAEAPATRHS